MAHAKVYTEDLTFIATESSGEVSAVLDRTGDSKALLILAHGAGAGMRHHFMEALAARLVADGVAVFRYQFPFTEQGRKRPDHTPKLVKTIRSAVAAATEVADGLPLFAGGKSMGGRLTSHVAAAGDIPDVVGLVFVGFPLHAPGRDGTERAAHLASVEQPMLFLQGTRDALAKLDLITEVAAPLFPRATLHVIEEANHGFHVPKRSGRTDDEVLDELRDATVQWIESVTLR